MKPYIDRAKTVAELAPDAPACFTSRDQWIVFLQSGASEQRMGRETHGPLLFSANQPPRFNYRFDFCKDCPAKHALAKRAKNECNPQYLRDLEAALPPRPPAPAPAPKQPATAGFFQRLGVGQGALDLSDDAPEAAS